MRAVMRTTAAAGGCGRERSTHPPSQFTPLPPRADSDSRETVSREQRAFIIAIYTIPCKSTPYSPNITMAWFTEPDPSSCNRPALVLAPCLASTRHPPQHSCHAAHYMYLYGFMMPFCGRTHPCQPYAPATKMTLHLRENTTYGARGKSRVTRAWGELHSPDRTGS